MIMESSEPMLSCLANLVITCGDYETQEGLILVLMRFSLASKKKLSKISKWFQMHLNDLSLIKILDYHDFDVTCREFLNTLNSAMISDAKVITIPAVDAYANEIHLQKPLMNKFRELWVDFSTSTGTIHTVCDMNGGAWLRLSIERPNVKKVTSSKRIMNESNAIQFLIELTTPLKVVLQSSEKYIATLTFMFMASLKIIELEEVFFKQCYREVYEDEKSRKINTAANIQSLDLSTRHEECLCKSIRSLSSIRTASSICKKKHCHKGGKKCDTPNLSPVPRSHLLATSTPKVPLLPRNSLNMKKENSGKSGTSCLKNMSESDYLNNEFLYNKFCNPNKWRKGSLIKYHRDTLLTDEDRKFKEMCEAKLIEAKDQLLNSSVSDTPKETDKNKNISNIGKNQCLGIKIPPNKTKVDTAEGRLITETQDRYTLSKDDKNEASDDSPYILITSKGAKTSAIPASINTSSSLKNDLRHSMKKADSNKQEIDSSSRLHRMKKLLAEGVSSGNKFGLPLSQKFSGIVSSSSEISNSKENKKFALQPSKLNILRPPSPLNRIIDESNTTSPCGLFKHPSADKNIRKPELNHINLSHLKKKPVFGVNTCPLADITNSYNSTNKISEEMSEPQEKKQKTLEIPPLFSKQKGQYESSFSNKIFNESHFLKYDLSVDKGSNKNKQLKNSENLKLSETPLAKMKTSAECKSSSTTEFPPSDKLELNSGDLSMKRFSSIKEGGIKAYEWNNSRSTTDQDSLSSSEFKKENNKSFGRNFIKNKNTFILEAAQCDKSNSCKEAVLELKKLAPQPGSGIINHNSQASNSSIHCRYPNKTYGNKSRVLNLLETSSDKIFRSLKSNEVKSSPSCIADKTVSKVSKKRKLFNPNNSIEEIIYSSQEKDNLMEVSNLTPFKCNGIQEERVECLKKKPNKSSRKNQKPLGTGSGQSKILKKFSPEGKAKPQIRRRSLRNKTKVKYVEMSSDDLENMSSDSGAVEPLGTLNENLKTKTDTNIKEIYEDNSSPNAICELEASDQVTENRLQTNKQPRVTQEKVVPDDQDNSNQELKAKVSNGKIISSSFENESSKAKEISFNAEKLASLDAVITEGELCPNPSCRDRSNLNSSKEVVESPVKLLPDCSTVVEEPVPIADGSPRLETNGTEEGVRAEVHFIDAVGGVNKPGTDTEISIYFSSVDKILKEVELVTKTSSADFQKKCSEVKENLVKTFEALNHSFDDFIDSLLNTISDANHRLPISQRTPPNNNDV